MAKRKKSLDKLTRTGIPQIKGEEYPFGEQEEQPASFTELFDGDIFDNKAVQNQALRQAEEQREKRLKRGHGYPPPQETLDLHGCTSQEAEDKTRHFIDNARTRGLRTIRIITGKGLHSPGGVAVLPDAIEQQLTLLKKEKAIAGFDWEKKVKSRSGALHVYL